MEMGVSYINREAVNIYQLFLPPEVIVPEERPTFQTKQ